MACLALGVCDVWLSQFMNLPGTLVPVQSIDGFLAHHWKPCPEVQFIIPSKLVSVVTSNSVYHECLIFPFQGFFCFSPMEQFLVLIQRQQCGDGQNCSCLGSRSVISVVLKIIGAA